MTKSALVWLLTVTHALSIKIDGDEIEEGQGATLRCQPSSDAMNGTMIFCLMFINARVKSVLEFLESKRRDTGDHFRNGRPVNRGEGLL